MLDSFADDPRFVSLTLRARSPPPSTARSSSRSSARPKVSDELARPPARGDGRQSLLHQGAHPLARRVGRHRPGRHGRLELLEGGGDLGRRAAGDDPAGRREADRAAARGAAGPALDRLGRSARPSTRATSRRWPRTRKASRTSIDRLILEGILEEERESRGDRLTFASGIVRDVLYAALSRRRRRSLHRKYAELIEKRSAGPARARLSRARPPLLAGRRPREDRRVRAEARPEVARHLQPRGCDPCGEDRPRVPRGRGVGRRALARRRGAPAARPGPAHDGQRRRRAAGGRGRRRGSSRSDKRRAAPSRRSCSPPRRPGRRAGSTTPAARSSAASRPRARPERPSRSLKLLALGATVANLRGEYAQGDGLPGRGRAPRAARTGGGRSRSRAAERSSSPCRTPSPRPSPAVYDTTEEHEVLANVFETLVTTDRAGQPRADSLRALGSGGRRRGDAPAPAAGSPSFPTDRR